MDSKRTPGVYKAPGRTRSAFSSQLLNHNNTTTTMLQLLNDDNLTLPPEFQPAPQTAPQPPPQRVPQSAPNPQALSGPSSSNVLANKRKRGAYKAWDDETRLKVARYAIDHNSATHAATWTQQSGQKLGESTVRGWVKKYKAKVLTFYFFTCNVKK